MHIKQFFKNNWYWITMTILIIIAVTLLIIGRYIKLDKSTDQPTNCQSINNDIPISSITISSDTKLCTNKNCCPIDSGTIVPINPETNWYINQPSNGKPYNQLCVKSAPEYCDQTSVVTDVYITDMGDGKGNYKPVSTRCCSSAYDPSCSYGPPVSINMPNSSSEDTGIILNSAIKAKMGLCVQHKPMGVLRQNKGQYININNLQFVSSTDTSKSGDEICSQLGSGWIAGGENLFKGNDERNMFLCKKYSKVQ